MFVIEHCHEASRRRWGPSSPSSRRDADRRVGELEAEVRTMLEDNWSTVELIAIGLQEGKISEERLAALLARVTIADAVDDELVDPPPEAA